MTIGQKSHRSDYLQWVKNSSTPFIAVNGAIADFLNVLERYRAAKRKGTSTFWTPQFLLKEFDEAIKNRYLTFIQELYELQMGPQSAQATFEVRFSQEFRLGPSAARHRHLQ